MLDSNDTNIELDEVVELDDCDTQQTYDNDDPEYLATYLELCANMHLEERLADTQPVAIDEDDEVGAEVDVNDANEL